MRGRWEKMPGVGLHFLAGGAQKFNGVVDAFCAKHLDLRNDWACGTGKSVFSLMTCFTERYQDILYTRLQG